jgi:hypothetical protein
MPEIELTVTPNAFNMPATADTIWQPITLRIPALPDASCYWVRVRTSAIKDTPPNQTTTTAGLSFVAPAVGIDTMFYGYLASEPGDPVYRSRIYSERTQSPPHIGISTLGVVNTNKLVARNITVWLSHSEPRATAYSELKVYLFSSCDSLPDDGDDDDEDDDDDDDPNSGSGLYRAIKADSERAYLHIGNEAAIETLNIVDGSEAFASGSHAVKWWKQFDYDRRQGRFYGLGRDTEGGSSHVKYSEDGGMSMTEVYEVECNSAVIQMDSEKRLLVLLAEGTPPDPEDDESNGAVTLYVCEDGTTFDNEGSPQYNSANLSARLLGMTYDPRSGGALFLLCQIAADKKILKSEDSGKSWTLFGGI